jgi:hypothetical protein
MRDESHIPAGVGRLNVTDYRPDRRQAASPHRTGRHAWRVVLKRDFLDALCSRLLGSVQVR